VKIARTNLALLLGILLAISLASSLGELGSTAPPAFADGALIPDIERDIYQPAQKAIIVHENGRQTTILQIKYEGDSDEFAWVIPVPGYPAVNVSDPIVFWYLADSTAPRVRGGSGGFLDCGSFGGIDGEPLVEVWEEDSVGIYDYAVLSAEDPNALIDWLNTNGYVFPEDGQEIIDHYISKEWYFVAVKIHTGDEAEGLAEGTIQPLELSFDIDEIIYPLKITSMSSDRCDVLLYVYSDQKVVPENYPYLTLNSNDMVLYLERVDDVFYLEDWGQGYLFSQYISRPLEGISDYLTKMRANINADNMIDIKFIKYEEDSFIDSDGDGWNDEEEAVAGTDPDNVDTDEDGQSDPEDIYPTGDPGLDPDTQRFVFIGIMASITLLIVAFALLRRRRTARSTTGTDDQAAD